MSPWQSFTSVIVENVRWFWHAGTKECAWLFKTALYYLRKVILQLTFFSVDLIVINFKQWVALFPIDKTIQTFDTRKLASWEMDLSLLVGLLHLGVIDSWLVTWQKKSNPVHIFIAFNLIDSLAALGRLIIRGSWVVEGALSPTVSPFFCGTNVQEPGSPGAVMSPYRELASVL